MDAFIGKWEFLESENFEAYCEKVGINLEALKAMAGTNPKYTMIVDKKANGYKIEVITPNKTISIEFELDREFEETTPDGRKLKSTFRLEGSKLIQEQKGEKSTRVERWVEDDKLIMAGDCEGVKFRRVYKKI